jgi:hypothetical protein
MTQDEEIERDRAMFGESDRKYLFGIEDYVGGLSRKADYNRRRAIVDRLRGSIEDFTIAQRQMGSRVWHMLVDLSDDECRQLRRGMISALAMFYEIHEHFGWDLEDTLYRAVQEAHTQGSAKRSVPIREVRNVNLDIDTAERPSVTEVNERLKEKVKNGEGLTDTDIAEGLKRGDIETKNAIEAYIEHQKTEDTLTDDRELHELMWNTTGERPE